MAVSTAVYRGYSALNQRIYTGGLLEPTGDQGPGGKPLIVGPWRTFPKIYCFRKRQSLPARQSCRPKYVTEDILNCECRSGPVNTLKGCHKLVIYITNESNTENRGLVGVTKIPYHLGTKVIYTQVASRTPKLNLRLPPLQPITVESLHRIGF